MNSPPSIHMLSTCFWMVFGDRFDAARCSRKGRNRATNCAPGGRSFSSPIHERGQPLKTALARSNNIFFANLGVRLGYDKVSHYAKLFGYGEKAGLNIPGEQPG